MNYEVKPLQSYLKSAVLQFDITKLEGTAYPCIAQHIHSMLELIYIIDGAMQVQSDLGSFSARKNELLIFSPYEAHSAYIDHTLPGVTYVYATISLPALKEGILLGQNPIIEDLLARRVCFEGHIKDETLAKEIGGYLCEIARQYAQKSKPEAGFLAHGNAALVIGKLLCANKLQKNTRHKDIDRAFLEKMMTFISQNYMHEITQEQLLSVFPYSRSHFCRLFSQNFGTSFSVYLRDYRLKKALELLKQEQAEGRKISDIALTVGFSDYCYFTHAFKKQFGITPREYLTCRH